MKLIFYMVLDQTNHFYMKDEFNRIHISQISLRSNPILIPNFSKESRIIRLMIIRQSNQT